MYQSAPGNFEMDPQRALLLPPGLKASPIESLTEQLFFDRSLKENRFWLRIKKESIRDSRPNRFRKQDSRMDASPRQTRVFLCR